MKIIIFFMLFLGSISSFAASVWHEAEIATIYPLANGSVVLTFKVAPPTCTNSGKYTYIKVDENSVTQEGLKNMLSVAMSAAVSKRPVNIYFNDASDGCYINRLYVLY